MLQMKRAVPDNRDAILRLWQAEFGDGAAFVDEFCGWCGWEQILLLWEDGEPRAMTAAPLTELAFPDGERAKVGYIYALTTLKEHRGRGFGGMLLRYADFCLQNQGAHGAAVVPAEEGLFPYFAAAGFETGFSLWEGQVDAPGVSPQEGRLRPASPEEYLSIQEERLAGLPHVVSPIGLLAQQKKLCEASGCGLYALKLPGGRGCAAVERQGDGFLLRELLTPAGEEEAALALLGETGRVTLRCPKPPGGREEERLRPFGMAKWYEPVWAEKWKSFEGGYLGLALD